MGSFFHVVKTICLFILGVLSKHVILTASNNSTIVNVAYYIILLGLVYKYSQSYRYPKLPETNFNVCIIGAGFSGIGMAIKLQEIGVKFRILDKNADLGGTWWVNQ